MALILLLETATDLCSVGLCEGNKLLTQKESSKVFDHVAQITRLINSCLEEAGYSLNQLDAIAMSNGPGSFTSLRVGTATAKGICYALDKPMIAIDTLQSLAWASQIKDQEKVLYSPMIDARRMEVYTALYDQHWQLVKPTEAHILTEESFKAELEGGNTLVVSGNGASKCQTILQHSNIIYTDTLCKASNLVKLAQEKFTHKSFEDVAYHSPQYFKPPNITKSKKNLL